MACYLMSHGHEVVMWDRNVEKVRQINEHGIKISGVISGRYYPTAQFCIDKAVSTASYILIMTTSSGHLPVCKLLVGKLPLYSRILIFNGNWGALECYNVLDKECREKGIFLGETSGMPILSDSNEVGQCVLTKVKNVVALATIPSSDAAAMIREISAVFPFLVPAQNVIETSINNTNPILHVPISLFNISRIENGENYSFYGDAASRIILQYVEKADQERLMIAEKAGAHGESALEILNGFWPDQYENLYDAIKNNQTYIAGKGPVSLTYRYITEDIPYGIVPLVHLSRRLNVSAPRLEALITMYNLLFDKDFLTSGPELTDASLQVAMKKST